MTFKLLSQEEFIQHTSASSQRSFMQTVEMAELLSKRGFSTQYVGYTDPGTGSGVCCPLQYAYDWRSPYGNQLRPCLY